MAVDIANWVKVMERIARDTYDGKLKPGDLDPAHIQKTYNELEGAAKSGYGKTWLKINKDTGAPDLTTLRMQKNLYWFSGSKDFAMLKDLNSKLVKDGKIQGWSAFKREALKLNKTYNKNYLEAEWINAKQSANHSQNWQEYQRNTAYKNLKYKTQGDDRVRDEHAKLNNVVKSKNDPWWDSFYPQNGWRCRCYTIETNEPVTGESDMPDVTDKDVAPEFRTNVGKTGQIFKESTRNGGKRHPFIQLAKDTPNIENKVNRLFYQLEQQKAKKILKNKSAKHAEIKTPITFNNNGISEAFNQPHKRYALKNMLIRYIDKIIPKSTYLGFVKRPIGNKMIVGSHIFKTVIDDVDSYIIIREIKNGDMVFYSISDSKKVLKGIKK